VAAFAACGPVVVRRPRKSNGKSSTEERRRAQFLTAARFVTHHRPPRWLDPEQRTKSKTPFILSLETVAVSSVSMTQEGKKNKNPFL